VSAFSGLETMQRAYAHAISDNYRFYSYGDACLLFLHSVFERSGTGSREENASNKS